MFRIAAAAAAAAERNKNQGPPMARSPHGASGNRVTKCAPLRSVVRPYGRHAALSLRLTGHVITHAHTHVRTECGGGSGGGLSKQRRETGTPVPGEFAATMSNVRARRRPRKKERPTADRVDVRDARISTLTPEDSVGQPGTEASAAGRAGTTNRPDDDARSSTRGRSWWSVFCND